MISPSALFLSLFTILSSVVLSIAQTGPQAAMIPACVKACDPPAIASVGCTNADQYCHCVRQQGILSNISACANTECDNPSRDIYVFTTLFGEVCEQFNISVPVLGSNGSASGTDVTSMTNSTNGASPNSTIVPFVGAASEVFVGQNVAWIWSGLLGFVVLAVLL